MSQNTVYIAEPIFSEKLQRFEPDAAFPPLKKIGITTDLPQRRERELLGTMSPIKVAIVKAWTGVDARKVESMLHALLDNTRVDGEYFWDGNETMVEAVTDFICTYYPDAREIGISEDPDVLAATEAVQKQNSQRMHVEVIPALEALSLKHTLSKNGNSVTFKLDEYNLRLSGRTAGRYTLTIRSRTMTTAQALLDFPGAQELTANATDSSERRARIPMTNLEEILKAITHYLSAQRFTENSHKQVEDAAKASSNPERSTQLQIQ